MLTKNRPFYIKLDNDWLEEIYQSAESRAAADKNIRELENRFTIAFDDMVTEYGAAPATGDWVEFENSCYRVAARTLLAPGASGGAELHIVVQRAPKTE